MPKSAPLKGVLSAADPPKDPPPLPSRPQQSPDSYLSLSSEAMAMGARFKKQAVQQHQILSRISSGTFSADKVLLSPTQLVRLISNLVKVVRSFKLVADLRPAERVAGELGQLRRLLRVDRLCLVGRDYWACLQKEKLGGLDYFMIVFRAVILIEDCSDLLAYLIQLGLVRGEDRVGELRRRVGDLYFLECIGWLLYYAWEYLRAETEEARSRNRIAVVRYLLDIAISHNDFSARRGELSSKTVSVLGVLSSLLNLYLVWK